MPASSSRKAKKLESFGVSTQYPQLSLHSAAASGNVGLVKFALNNGQPASSVLNGVLPIHAACSNGNEAIVRMLIENGADVNAPRLPRRYSSDRRVNSTWSVGTSGSTPLHFAAANGHKDIVELLLACGARPDLTEKNGLTPEAIAQEYGYLEVVDMLRRWDRQAAAQVNEASQSQAVSDWRNGVKSATLPPPSLQMSPIGSRSRLHSSSSLASLKNPLATSASLMSRKSSSTSLRSSTSASKRPSSPRISLGRTDIDLPVTYSSLTLQPNTSSFSLQDGSSRRPSLPAVFEKAANSREAIKQAFGIRSHSMSTSKPPPLRLHQSNSEAFDASDTAHGLKRAPSSGSTRSAIASVFGRKRQSSVGSHISSAETVSDELTPTSAPTQADRLSPGARILHEAKTAPPSQLVFFPPSQISEGKLPPRTPSYRPRKASILSQEHTLATDTDTDAADSNHPEEAADEVKEMPISPSLLQTYHGRTPSNGSSASGQQTESSQPAAESDDQLGVRPFRSQPRLRADSVGSTSSSLSPYTAIARSPLGSTSGESYADVRNRPSRSTSNATDPDLRQMVLREGMDQYGPASPNSVSSWSGFTPASLHSTPASSVIHSSGSVRDPPASPRKFSGGEVITPSIVQNMVREAEDRLMSFNVNAAEPQLSLSEQLAAYGDTLALQRRLDKGKARSAYTFEKLDREGNRTPIEVVGPSAARATLKPQRPFQQGVLDARRQPPPQLRQGDTTPTIVIPPAVPPSVQLQSNVNKIYDHRSHALSHHRPQNFQYRILESNQPLFFDQSARSISSRRSSPSSIDDPVRSSATSSSTSSAPSLQVDTRSQRTKRGKQPQVEDPPQLVTPTASRGEPDTIFGIKDLEVKDRKGKFAKSFETLKHRVF